MTFGTVRCFKAPLDAKEEARQVAMEAAEVYSAVEDWERDKASLPHALEECADLMQALANLVQSMTGNVYGTSMEGYSQRVRAKNEARGREYE